LERGPNGMQGAVLSILHCLLHYVDFNLSANAQQVNSDLLRVIAKYIEVLHMRAFCNFFVLKDNMYVLLF